MATSRSPPGGPDGVIIAPGDSNGNGRAIPRADSLGRTSAHRR